MYTVYCYTKIPYKKPTCYTKAFGTKCGPHGSIKQVVKWHAILKKWIFFTMMANDQSNGCVCHGGTLIKRSRGAATAQSCMVGWIAKPKPGMGNTDQMYAYNKCISGFWDLHRTTIIVHIFYKTEDCFLSFIFLAYGPSRNRTHHVPHQAINSGNKSHNISSLRH